MTEYAGPLPTPTIDTAPFWEHCRKHELRMQKCLDCGHVRYPASVICPKCYSENSEWASMSGKGTIYSWVVFHQAYGAFFAGIVPYAVAIVELAEGPRMLTNIIACPLDEIDIGMPVEVAFEDITAEFALPKFRPLGKP
ncbi:MAG: Zn-ribbon domain-containing OB-fold protein [Chloroflexi bacterium]|nr:Zn-ribbon domain-containing OB-fold protein [Chloroflexota bacterium]